MRAPKLTQEEVVEKTIASAKKHRLGSKELEDQLTEAGCSREEVSKLVGEYSEPKSDERPV